MADTAKDLELFHYGVKGMKWGVRRESRASRDAPNENYTSRQRAGDRNAHGKRYEKRVNREMNKGSDLKTARKKVRDSREKRKTTMTNALVVASAAAYIGYVYSNEIMHLAAIAGKNVQNKRQTRAGAREAAAIFSDDRGIANYSTVQLQFNKTKNLWE